jgi:hypothetical protein
MNGIFWLASYPKSGNTWLRVFLAGFLRDDGSPVDINRLDVSLAAGERETFDSALGIESSDMTEDEIERFRPLAWRYLAQQSATTSYVKTHDAYTLTSEGVPPIPGDASLGAVYVVRNPLDVAVSFAHHFTTTIDDAIRKMGCENTRLGVSERGTKTSLAQRLLSWSGHVRSWLDQRAIPVCAIRYEDMKLRPLETFSEVGRFLGLPAETDRVMRAVEASALEALRQQERDHGFREKLPDQPSFFREGRAGAWRSVLTAEQVARIVGEHGAVMRRLGYVGEDGSVEGV